MASIGEGLLQVCYPQGMDQFIPERYRLRLHERPSLLQRTLQAAPEEAMSILEEAVNWQEPVAVLSTYRMPSSEQKRGQLRYTHPLNAVLRTGRLDLFQRALELATTDREDQVYIEGEKDFSTPYDWVGNKVLSSTVCYGSLAHIHALMEALKKNSLHMRTITPDSDDNVWKDLAVYATGDQPRSHWVSVLQILDEQVRSDLGLHVRHPPNRGKNGKPPAPSKWTSMERKIRRNTHTMALEWAAGQGNAAMVDALLSMGHAVVTPRTLVQAWHSDGSDLAIQLLQYSNRKWEQSAYHPTSLEELGRAVTRTWKNWMAAIPGQLSFAPFSRQDVAMQQRATLESLELFLAWTVEHKHVRDAAPASAFSKNDGKEWNVRDLAVTLRPVLMAMDEERLAQVSPMLETLGWPHPSWKECEEFLDVPLSAYQRFQQERLQRMDATQATAFMEGLGGELEMFWRDMDQLATIKAVRQVMFDLMRPSGMSIHPTKWLEKAADGVASSFPEEALAVFREELLDEKLEHAPTRARPRF